MKKVLALAVIAVGGYVGLANFDWDRVGIKWRGTGYAAMPYFERATTSVSGAVGGVVSGAGAAVGGGY